MIDFSTLKELYVDGKKVTSLFLDGHEVPMSRPSGPQYLTVTALDQQVILSIKAQGSPDAFSLEYSIGGGSWSTYSAESALTLNAGSYVMFRRQGVETTVLSKNGSNFWYFDINNPVKVSGNIMSLLDASCESTTIGQYAFYHLFAYISKIVDASELELPATTLAEYCYNAMFYNCSSLSSAPVLPATTLANNCYAYMFGNCSSLISAPALPATTLASGCYDSMFQDCKSLSSAPALPAMTLAGHCYQNMFQGCTSLSSAPALPATTLHINCYQDMFNGCASLSVAPALPATTLASSCYQNMFRGCTSLATAPALPATTLASICYQRMFTGCSSLSSMDVKFTAWSPSTATNSWLFGVAATGTFRCPADLDTTISDDSHIPSGWTVVQPTVKYADYVQTNNYVLDTLYKPTVNTSLSTCLSGNANGQCFIGFKYYSDQQDYRLFNAGNQFYFDMGSGAGDAGGRVQTSGWDSTKWTDISAWNFGFKFTPEGGSEISATSTRHSTVDWDANGTINIAGYTTSTGQSDMCIKFLKIYESNVLVRDFKAAVDENDAAGLYDEVEGEFYYPTGGAWTAFGVVTPPAPTPEEEP